MSYHFAFKLVILFIYLDPKCEHFGFFRINNHSVFSDISRINKFIQFTVYNFELRHNKHLLSLFGIKCRIVMLCVLPHNKKPSCRKLGLFF